ncbi:MAG: hypothetical protein CM1200mP39_26780 [Dehalococcoidia bacterium]|nr:MAG: hypothetical protein CM1200mP39_26780 [Dehalococcoidia bacterium]
MGTTNQLRRFGADIRGVEIDEGGIIPEALRSDPQLLLMVKNQNIYIRFPEHQNPTGSTLSRIAGRRF